MFETVAPEQFVKRDRKPLYEAVPFSIAVHSLLVGAALVGNIWTVSFPHQSPAQVAVFSLTEIPPPPPPPPPPPKARTQPPDLAIKPVEIPAEIVAPIEIPEKIPQIEPRTVIAAAAPGPNEGVEGGIEGGLAGGVIGGVLGGEIGGALGGIVGGLLTDQVKIPRDKPLPMFPLSQVYPSYPEKARMNAWEDQLVVRYIIGKDGRVKDVTVISPPDREIFIEATLRAIRSWRFRPLIKDGQRQEVTHELTVLYRLVQPS